MNRPKAFAISIVIIWTAIYYGQHIATKFFNSEYSDLRDRSNAYSQEIPKQLSVLLSKNPKEILIADLTPFMWDQVCILSDNTKPRESVRHANYLNKDFPILAGFNRIDGSALVFVGHGRIIALIEHSDIDIRYGKKFCARANEAILIPIQRGKDFTPEQGGFFARNKSRDAIKPLYGCINSNICSYVFWEK